MTLLKPSVEGVTLGDDVKINDVRRAELHSMERVLRVGQLKIHFINTLPYLILLDLADCQPSPTCLFVSYT